MCELLNGHPTIPEGHLEMHLFFIDYGDACDSHWVESRLDFVFHFSTSYDKEAEPAPLDRLLVAALRWGYIDMDTSIWYWYQYWG